MKRLFLTGLILLALGHVSTATAQRSAIGISFDGGLNTLVYSPLDGERNMGMGTGAGLYIAYYANKEFCIHFGLHYLSARASATYNFTETSLGLTHPDNTGVSYDLTTTLDNWKERQTIRFLSVPVEFFWCVPLDRTKIFLLGLGTSVDLPTKGRYFAEEGTCTTMGYFPATGHTVRNQPQHGFGDFDADSERKIKGLNVGMSLLADIGMRMALDNKMGLYVGLYAIYGLTDIVDVNSTQPLVTLNTNDASRIVYNGTFASKESDAMHLFCVGLKVGIEWW